MNYELILTLKIPVGKKKKSVIQANDLTYAADEEIDSSLRDGRDPEQNGK